MTTQTILWTAIPNGVGASGKYRLSIHVAPRLVPNTSPGQLSEFPDFVTWPSTALTGINVQFGYGQVVSTTVVTNPAAAAARWSDLFGSTTPVRGRVFQDYTTRRVRSYPVGNVVAHLRDSYALYAITSGDTYPSVSQLQPFIGPLMPDLLENNLAQVEADNGPPNYTIGPGAPNPSYDYAQLQRFHTPPAVIQPGTGPSLPQVDFHDMLGYAQDHPVLLRLLRLVIDVELNQPPTSFGFTTVRVRVAWSPSVSGTIDVSPLTECSITASSFEAVAMGGDVANGYLRLDDTSRFGVAPVDQDGGALKAINFAAEIERSQQGAHNTADTPGAFALPAIRATGLAAFRSGRAANLRSAKFVRGLNTLDANLTTGAVPGDNVLLFADDLTQGGRFDAMDAVVGVWRSLGARSGQLRFLASNTTFTITGDEAPTNDAAGGAHDGSSDDLYLGETIATWNGWSLGAPRPGQFVDSANEQVQPHTSTADPQGMQLEISHAVVPGSLPRLRFGRTYLLRARAVDIAGNSLPLSDPSPQHASPPTLFGRLDPVQSPAVLLRSALAPSDAIERVVLRSNYNVPPSPQTAERHLVAPKVSQRTAELHGMFDTAANPSVVDANAYALIANRESKQVSDLGSAQPDPSGQPDVYYFDVNGVTVPYLPDPVARGALLRGLGSGGDLTVTFAGTWPDLAGVRLVARERQGGDPDYFYDAPNNRVDVFLDKAERRAVRLSTVPDAAQILEFLLWRWVVDANGASAQLQGAVTSGAHWMFTPYRDLTFVHAVKQPLAPPDFTSISALRNTGETFATLAHTAPASFSRASTARVDLEASWDEYEDAGPGTAAPTRPDPAIAGGWLDRPTRSAIALSMPIADLPSGPPAQLSLTEAPPPGPRHEFGDTKHRDVTYAARGYSRFDEFFRRDGTADFGANNATNPASLDPAGVVAGSVRLSSVVNGATVVWAEGRDFTVDAAAGTVSRLDGSGATMPDKVAASWVARPNDRLTSSPVLTSVPASARPDPPHVLYVVPTFAWQSSGGGGQQTRTRVGGGVRVYLQRPWWSSGGGELLGVVLANSGSGQSPLDEQTALVATQWGIDPVHAGKATPDVPDASMFPLRVATGSFVVAAEHPSASLSVAGHAVDYDPSRDLWYCDIDLATGATWMPFVRLALARYQPSAIGNLQLSPVLLADFVQLAADRSASVVPTGKPRQYTVQLGGPSYNITGSSGSDPLGPRATVKVQQLQPGFASSDPLGWKTVATKQLTRQVFSGPTVAYSAVVSISIAALAAGARLLFEEFEQLRVDGLANSTPRYGDRPIYADVLVLS